MLDIASSSASNMAAAELSRMFWALVYLADRSWPCDVVPIGRGESAVSTLVAVAGS